MKSREWSSEILNSLILKSGKTYDQIADDAGIGRSTLSKIINDRYPPSANLLIALADYFGVTIDFLCGRNIEDTDAVANVFPQYFTGLLRCGYEQSLRERRKPIEGGAISVWPYNLLEDIFQEQIQTVLSQDQEDGLDAALKTLSVREEECVRNVYQNDKSYIDIGHEYKLSANRIMQIVHKGIRKLRHPSRLHLIQDGLKGSEEIREELVFISSEKRRLLKERAELEEINSMSKIPILDHPLDVVLPELTIRTTNCLLRGDLKTLKDLIQCLEDGKLWKIRGMGCRCVEETIGKLYFSKLITLENAVRYCDLNKIDTDWMKLEEKEDDQKAC